MRKFPTNIFSRRSHLRCSVKTDVLKNFVKITAKHLCWSLFFLPCAFIKTEPLTQVSSCEFWKIFKTPVFIEHFMATVLFFTFFLARFQVSSVDGFHVIYLFWFLCQIDGRIFCRQNMGTDNGGKPRKSTTETKRKTSKEKNSLLLLLYCTV